MKKPWLTPEGAKVWKDSKGEPSESQYWSWLDSWVQSRSNIIPQQLPIGITDLTGKVKAKLKVIGYIGIQQFTNQKQQYWCCYCECGNVVGVNSSNLNDRSNTYSCGCQGKEKASKRMSSLKFNLRHGLSGHPLYDTWYGAYSRCCVKTNKDYPNYGGRGINFCANWLPPASVGFVNFLNDMRDKPDDRYSLERKDNSLGYSRDNCEWVPPETQNVNKRTSRNYPYVYPDGSRWRGMYEREGYNNYVGMFPTEPEAFLAVLKDMRLKGKFVTDKLLELERGLLNYD